MTIKPFTAWIALSDKGFPAYSLGYFPTRKALRASYWAAFGHHLEMAGYRAKKVFVMSVI